MDIETRLKNLEKLVNALSKKIDNTKFYQDAEDKGLRQSDSELGAKHNLNAANIDYMAMEMDIDLEV